MGIQALNDKGTLLFIVSGRILRSFSTWVSETTVLSLLFEWWWAFRSWSTTYTSLMNLCNHNIVVIWIIVLSLHITPKRNEIYGCGHICVAPSLFALVGGGGNLVGTIRHILPFNCTPDHSSHANSRAFNCWSCLCIITVVVVVESQF